MGTRNSELAFFGDLLGDDETLEERRGAEEQREPDSLSIGWSEITLFGTGNIILEESEGEEPEEDLAIDLGSILEEVK